MTGIREKKRADEMYAAYCEGKSQSQIGEMYGITRQAVSVLFSRHGYICDHIGYKKRIAEGRAAKQSQKDSRSIAMHGIPYEKYKYLLSIGATVKYVAQRTRARARGIAWNFNLGDWWEVWEKSGKWEQRGLGTGRYVMARFGDIGPYSKDNVRIITHNENSSECREKYWSEKAKKLLQEN